MKVQLYKHYIKSIKEIAEAKANVDIYLHNPAGIGEHPDVLDAIQFSNCKNI